MPWFPIDAAEPTTLSTEATGLPLRLPAAAAGQIDSLPAEGLPPTPEGALAQLVILNENGTRGGDPAQYQRSYSTLSAPGGPGVETTGIYTLLAKFRESAGLANEANPPGLSVTYEVTHGLIKGTVDQGRYVVACVLGQMAFAYQGRTIVLGVGDCQALRRTGEVWRISPGPVPAYASNTWPGSADCVRAGYQAVIR
ncbi:hypothetical protein L3Q67_01805 [Saccharothrix sp. AJ9571]|nr:hypothetical protein L3Q67_01805 [Saccharothrix sp. AJ9571]